jgi:hypothetical protein
VTWSNENEWLCIEHELVWAWVKEGYKNVCFYLISLLAIVIALRESQLKVDE